MPRPAGVICSGNIVYDVMVRPADEIRWGGTIWVDEIAESMGGNGANTSYTLARLGVPVTLLGRIGRDPFGDVMFRRLAEAGVSMDYVERSDTPSASSVALVKKSGDRAFLHRPGCSREVFAEPIQFGAAMRTRATHYHLANPYSLPNLRGQAAATLARARGAGLTTSLDTAWDSRGEWMSVLQPCLPLLDLLFVNEDEARMLTGHAAADDAAAMLLAGGAAAVVVKLGGAGCRVYGGAERFASPAFRVNVLDTTGAGDCFAGGFLGALARGLDAAGAAEVANAAGGLCAGAVGATHGIQDWDSTIRWMEGMERNV
ncbi:MAG: carbohydrate kinase family protein [Acidobacteria bacterium]|nr:carbohydrate kinase family protein [Acidobacteriota bacterium]